MGYAMVLAAMPDAIEVSPSPRVSALPARDLLASGVAAMARGQVEQAALQFRGLVGQAPEISDHHWLCGDALVLAGRPDHAIPYFEQAIRLSPTHRKSWFSLWQAKALLGENIRSELAAIGCVLPVSFAMEDCAVTNLALTIDDGPTPETTPALLEVLANHNVHATFFVLGARAAAYPHLIEQLVAAGHHVAPHGWSHQILANLPGDAIFDEIVRTEEILSRVRPTPGRPWIRLPFGLGWDMAHVHVALQRWHHGARIAQWSACFFEWLTADAHRQPGPAFEHACAASVSVAMRRRKLLSRGIALAHDHMVGLPGDTAHLAGPRTVDHFLRMAMSDGYTVGPLPE